MYHSWRPRGAIRLFRNLAFFFIVIVTLTLFRWPTMKGHCSIYTKVSLPLPSSVSERKRHENWIGSPVPQTRSTFRHFRRFLMSRRINASENRESAPEKTGYTRVILRTRFSRIFSVSSSGRYCVFPKPFPTICPLYFFVFSKEWDIPFRMIKKKINILKMIIISNT